MTRLNINLMPFQAYLRNNASAFKLNHFFYNAELQHIESISLFADDDFIADEQLLSFCNSNIKYLILYTSLHNNNYEKLLKFKPNMIIFCDNLDKKSHEALAVKQELSDAQKECFASVASHDIRTGVVTQANVKTVKAISQAKVDYLHFDLSAINSATDIDTELDLLEELNIALLAANKIGFGILAGGKLNLDNYHLFSNFDLIEEFITGQNLLDMSIINGFTNSIQNFRSHIKRM